MVFYNYTMIKIIKTLSTWITLIIAVLPQFIYVIFSMAQNAASESSLPMITFYSMPLPIIFVTYKAGQVFRDEIENKTLLTIQSKPISKLAMITQGLLAIFTCIAAFVIVGIILPGLIVVGIDSHIFLIAIMIGISEGILLSMIGLISFKLSLTFKGKAYIGIMIGAFGTGFYILLGASVGLKALSSRNSATINFVSNNIESDKNIQDNSISFTPSTIEVGDSLEEIYKEAKDSQKYRIYDYFEWFNPTSHWMRMFGSILSANNKKISHQDAISTIFEGATNFISDINVEKDANGKISKLTVKFDREKTLPIWYPFILWGSIGILATFLSIKSIQKRNIS